MRPDRRKLIRRALEFHAPLSDAQLCWWMTHFGMKPGQTRKLRYTMTRNGEIRFARRVRITAAGRTQKMWELSPRKIVVSGQVESRETKRKAANPRTHESIAPNP